MPLSASVVCPSSASFDQIYSQRNSFPALIFANSCRRSRTHRIAQAPSPDASCNCMLSIDVQPGGRASEFSRDFHDSTCAMVCSYDLGARSGVGALNLKKTGFGIQARVCSNFVVDSKDSRIVGLWSSSCRRVRTMGNGEFHLVLDYLNGGLPCPQSKRRWGLAISCSVTVPVPSEHSPVDNATKAKGAEFSKDSPVNETKSNAREPLKAAFFDVDGTITRTNVVLAYLSVRLTELSLLKKLLWLPWFALSCIVYLVVDHIHRPTFNRIFYLSYKGRPADGKIAMANLIYERYYKPRIMTGAVEQIQELKQLGYHIVFVTGALDFQIAPLARDLGADFVYAAKLVEENGRFTGELNGMATSNSEKAERVWDYARRFGVSLIDSLAFGDSIADIDMLEVVGKPHAVNPDARLQAIALKRGWAILNWCIRKQKAAAAVPA